MRNAKGKDSKKGELGNKSKRIVCVGASEARSKILNRERPEERAEQESVQGRV